MLRFLSHSCHRLLVGLGLRRERHGRFRDGRFSSFLAQSNRSRIDTDLRDAMLNGRKLMKNVFRLALAGGCAWIALESAKALSVF